MCKAYRSAVQGLLFLLLLNACASNEAVLAPDTQAGARLQPEYLLGEWCNNRELTSKANSEAGHSALTNLSKVFWKFRSNGQWQNSASGWMYGHYGNWQLQPPDRFVLDPARGNAVVYQASFRNSGADLYLEDEKGQFLILSRCN